MRTSNSFERKLVFAITNPQNELHAPTIHSMRLSSIIWSFVLITAATTRSYPIVLVG